MSGILIKNIEMPTSCEKCKTMFGCCACEDGTVWCRLAQGYIGDKRTVCPLSSVREHGRCIDADALWVEINKICDRRDAGIITDLTCLQQILSALRHAPTIIEADSLPVLHGTFAASSKEEAIRRLTGEVET